MVIRLHLFKKQRLHFYINNKQSSFYKKTDLYDHEKVISDYTLLIQCKYLAYTR